MCVHMCVIILTLIATHRWRVTAFTSRFSVHLSVRTEHGLSHADHVWMLFSSFQISLTCLYPSALNHPHSRVRLLEGSRILEE